MPEPKSPKISGICNVCGIGNPQSGWVKGGGIHLPVMLLGTVTGALRTVTMGPGTPACSLCCRLDGEGFIEGCMLS